MSIVRPSVQSNPIQSQLIHDGVKLLGKQEMIRFKGNLLNGHSGSHGPYPGGGCGPGLVYLPGQTYKGEGHRGQINRHDSIAPGIL